MAKVKDVFRVTVGVFSRLVSVVALVAIAVISVMLFRNLEQTKETQGLTSTLQTIRTISKEKNDTDWSNGMLRNIATRTSAGVQQFLVRVYMR